MTLVACSSDTGSTGDGGSGAAGGGGTGGSTASSTTSTGDTGGGSGVGGGTGGSDTSGFDACKAAALTDDATCAGCGAIATFAECTEEFACDGSADLLNAIRTCTCDPAKCATECAGTCDGSLDTPTAECVACSQGTADAPGKCAAEASACANDI